MYDLFIFRRDFRKNDNLALNQTTNQVIPIFIFDPKQINTKTNYFSSASFEFLKSSLLSLKKEIPELSFHLGKPVDVISKIVKGNNIDKIYFNADFSEYSKERDNLIKNKFGNKVIINENDLYLPTPKKIYKKFGSFHIASMKLNVPKPYTKNIKFKGIKSTYNFNIQKDKYIYPYEATRKQALKLLKSAKMYKQEGIRDSTYLSPYIKYGLISIREAYYAHSNNIFRKQLYWRSYYFNISREVCQGYLPKDYCDPRYKKIKFISGKDLKNKWELLWNKGQTGFPLVDAAIQELKQTGFMHNRCRLIVACFSIKILKIDPLDIKYGGINTLARMLVDCCYANNTGNWLWVLGVWDYAGKRFGKGLSGRMFDPYDFKKIDPKAEYIKKWLPKFKNVDIKKIARWDKYYSTSIHPKPIVDYFKEKEKWIDMTKNLA